MSEPVLRRPDYLSPSALKCYEESADMYYKRYLSKYKPPREPQNRAMAAGSAFDAYVKSELYKTFARNKNEQLDQRYSLAGLMESQVEAGVREWAYEMGAALYSQYVALGGLADLATMVAQSVAEPRFEFELRASVAVEGVRGGVPLLGKPDLWFTLSSGRHVTHDFKVNGACSTAAISPMIGYYRERSARKSNGKQHSSFVGRALDGVIVNTMCLSAVNSDWADQLTTYGWLLGAEIGDESVYSIDQICCCGGAKDGSVLPEIRVAQHRGLVSGGYQRALLSRYGALWSKIMSGQDGGSFHFFTDRSLAESQQHCLQLDSEARVAWGFTADDQWIVEAGRIAW